MNNLTWKYVKKLKNKKAIENFENENKIKLPIDIIECVKKNNGGRPNKKTFDTENSKERVIKNLLSFNSDDLETVYSIFEVLNKEDNRLFPIASDPSGNYICYDLMNKKIVLWLHETNKVENISNDFSEFLDALYE